jgi:hypothetical protein
MVAIRVTPERKGQGFESQQHAGHCDHHSAPRGAHERDTAADVPTYFSEAQPRFNYSNSASGSDGAEFELLKPSRQVATVHATREPVFRL